VSKRPILSYALAGVLRAFVLGCSWLGLVVEVWQEFQCVWTGCIGAVIGWLGEMERLRECKKSSSNSSASLVELQYNNEERSPRLVVVGESLQWLVRYCEHGKSVLAISKGPKLYGSRRFHFTWPATQAHLQQRRAPVDNGTSYLPSRKKRKRRTMPVIGGSYGARAKGRE
jgi:hypothetical protein